MTAPSTTLRAVPLPRCAEEDAPLAWLLRRSPDILLIPGTSSVAHFDENLAVATLDLPADAMTALDGIAGASKAAQPPFHPSGAPGN